MNIIEKLKKEKLKWENRIYGVGETRIDLMIEDVIRELQKYQAELEKKDKVINEMAEMINNHDIEEDVCNQMGKNRHCNDFIVSERNCINCIIEYFTNKVEGK